MSLILPVASADAVSAEKTEQWRQGLERAGHTVDVVVVLEADAALGDEPAGTGWAWISAGSPGLAAASVAGLREAAGDSLVVLDARQGYHADDLSRLVAPLTDGEADLVVARRTNGAGSRRALPDVLFGLLSKPVLGAADPFSGLVALTPALADEFVGTFEPVGSWFTIDLLFRAGGRKVEVPVRTMTEPGSGARSSLGIDDLRHVKRLADDRFGTLSRLVQFCVVGASGMLVDLTCYALFQLLLSWTVLAHLRAPWIGGTLDLAAAGALAIALALTWNFSLNRRLTFNDTRYGSIPRQFLAYVLSNALGIALSFSLRLYLPAHVAFFGRHRLAAAVVGIVTATGISFSMARWVVFNRRNVDVVKKAHRRGRANANVAQTLQAR